MVRSESGILSDDGPTLTDRPARYQVSGFLLGLARCGFQRVTAWTRRDIPAFLDIPQSKAALEHVINVNGPKQTVGASQGLLKAQVQADGRTQSSIL